MLFSVTINLRINFMEVSYESWRENSDATERKEDVAE